VTYNTDNENNTYITQPNECFVTDSVTQINYVNN